jgi:hypothetical protein
MKILLFNFNGILDEVEAALKDRGHEILPHIYKGSEINSWKKADTIVLWNETDNGGWKEWLAKMNKWGKRTILIQHGRRGTSRLHPPFNEKLKSDVVCVWGRNDVKRILKSGTAKEEQMFLTGTPVVRNLKPKVPHKGINVVFSPEHWDIDVAENLIVKSALEKVRGVNIISKLLIHEHTPGLYPNPVWSNRMAKDHLDIVKDTLAKADVVVAISESTFELMAEIMDIPVIIADIWVPKACAGDERYREYTREYSNACTMVKDLSKLGDAIKYAIKHPEHLRAERKQIGIDDGGMDIEDPVAEIIKVIENK